MNCKTCTDQAPAPATEPDDPHTRAALRRTLARVLTGQHNNRRDEHIEAARALLARHKLADLTRVLLRKGNR